MNWLLNLSTRAKLFLGFGVMLLFLGVLGATAYGGIALIWEKHRVMYEEDFADVSGVQELLANLDENRARLLTMVLVRRKRRHAICTNSGRNSNGSWRAIKCDRRTIWRPARRTARLS